MAARCQATYSNTPASLIYAQSWPVPSSHAFAKRYPGKPASNSPRKSLNSSWIYETKRPNTTSEQANSSTHKSRSWASSMLNQYPEWIEDDSHMKLDMAKEFKLTLQMFKKLTQQVKEVDEQLNSCRKPYLFKHYFTNKDDPGIHRSQLAVNMRSFPPEVPMTNQAYQPCNNFGLKREKQRPHSHLGIYRKNDKSLNSIFQKPKAEEPWSSSIPVRKNKSSMNESENHKSLNKQKYQETPSKEECLSVENCKDFSWLSSADLNSEEDLGFGYIDPVPDDWDKKKLEELEQDYFADKKEKQDPFLNRYLELRRLQAETLENERRNPKMEESVENVSGLNCGSAKTNGNGNSQGKKLCCSSKKLSSRTNDEKTKVSGFKSINLNVNKYSKSCVSKYVEGKMEKKIADVKEKKRSKRNKSARTRKKVPVAQYDIVELATSFDPPSKDRIHFKSRPVTAKSAKSKGLLPGKSWYSQRRFSLTSDQACLQIAPADNDLAPVPINKSTSTTKSCKKSAKRNTKRCASSRM